MSIQAVIEEKLAHTFNAEHLQVENESHMHNVAPGSESHFKVVIVSDQFKDEMLIKRHRWVNQTLADELKKIHALAIHTFSPEEWQQRAASVAESPACRGGGKNQ